MCLAMPAQVTNFLNERAIINLGGVTKEISISLLDQIAIAIMLLFMWDTL